MTENSLIKDIGRSYIVSSFVPAALFLAIAALIFKDFVPFFLLRQIIDNDQLFVGQWAILILAPTWLGFALYSGWNTTVRLFEGYYFPNFIKRYFTNRIKRIYQAKRVLLDEFNILASLEKLSPQQECRMNELDPQMLGTFQELEMNFPIKGELLPTRLGNILRASERYPFDRYKIEAITIFPRLVHLFPSEFNIQLEESNNKFIFLLNSSFLALSIGVLSVFVSILRVPCYLFNENLMREGLFSFYGQNLCTFPQTTITNFFQAGFRNINEWEYFFLGLVFLVFGYILYRAATIMARAYANLIRSGYDLYRLELFKNLHIPLTNDFKDEKEIWYNLSHFFNNGGDVGGVPIIPDFMPKGEAVKPTPPPQPRTIQLDVSLRRKR
ncbi:MAG TPA: hypothetical protein VEA58_05070 [Anaerovoracaceae bacterium]|nr:hypothetical protein [Anaerovoracaceae bacterium]